MNKFDILIKYIPIIQDDKIGEWVMDTEGHGTQQDPIHVPFVNYSDLVNSFIRDVYRFAENNKDMKLNNYGEILNKNNIQ